MRLISQSLLKAQQSVSPAARVLVRFEDAGFWNEDSADWQLLATIGAGDNGLTAEPHAAVVLDSGVVVVAYNRSDVEKIYARRVANPASAADWATTPTQVASGSLVGTSALGDDMVILANSNEVRILYPVNSDMYQVKSTDGGATWGAGALVYSPSGDGFGNAVGFYHASLGWVVFHRPDGIEMVRSASGTTWTATTQYASTLWNPIGVDTYDATNQTVRVFLLGGEGNRRVVAQITYSFATNTYSNLTYIDHGGNQFAPAPQRTFVGRGLNGLLLVGLEGTSNGQQYPVLANVHATLPLCDEPVLYASNFLFEQPGRRVIPVVASGITYLVGRKYIHHAPRKLGTGTIGNDWLVPVGYSYDRQGSEGGEIDIELPAGIGYPRVGCLVRVRRGLYVDGGGGEVDLLARVVYVGRQRDRLLVQALDGLGVLGLFRARRSFPMVATYYTWVKAIEGTVARAGVYATVSDATLITATDYKDFVFNANENALSFLFRLLRNKTTLYRTKADTMGAEFIVVPTNSPYAYGEGGHPLIDWGAVQDGRALGLAVFGGRTSATDVIAQGETWGVADGARFPGVRPVPTVYIDRRLIEADLESAANGEGERQQLLNADAQIVAAANLGLEVYDRVALTVEEMDWTNEVFRVNGIRETWENGLLLQELNLGDDT